MRISKLMLLFAIIGAVIFVSPHPTPAAAQATRVFCGSVITGEFTQESELHIYEIELNVGNTINLTGTTTDDDLFFGILLYGPSDRLMAASQDSYWNSDTPDLANPTILSGALSASGVYTIRVTNGYFYGQDKYFYNDGKDDPTGAYQLQIACTVDDNTPIPAGTPDTSIVVTNPSAITVSLAVIRSQSVTPVACGQIIASEFTLFAEIQRYSIDIADDDQSFWITVTPVGDYLRTAMSLYDPSGDEVQEIRDVAPSPSIQVSESIEGGAYQVVVANTYLLEGSMYYRDWSDYNGGVGLYVIGVGCRYADGTTVNPGDTLVQSAAPATSGTDVEVTADGDGGTSTAENCPNSPAPRLEIGGQGRVVPGDANNLRDDPQGSKIGELEAETEFDVLEGPVCGRDNMTFWRVQAGDLTGWTAEGQGEDYWLEPIQDGRG